MYFPHSQNNRQSTHFFLLNKSEPLSVVDGLHHVEKLIIQQYRNLNFSSNVIICFQSLKFTGTMLKEQTVFTLTAYNWYQKHLNSTLTGKIVKKLCACM